MIRPLNQKVAHYIRENNPIDIKQSRVDKALDILESPWPRRNEMLLRKWFNDEEIISNKSKFLIDRIIDSGLEPFIAPQPLPPIEREDIKLLTWMAITKKSDN